jgi:hypothetical protein
MQANNEEWVTMKEAASRLEVAPSKLSRLAGDGKIRTKRDTVDGRVTLVDVNEVRALLQSSVTYKKRRQFAPLALRHSQFSAPGNEKKQHGTG